MNAISPRTLAVREQPLPEPVIQCPHCQGDIKLTESLAAPFIRAREAEFKRQEAGLREREAALRVERDSLESQVAARIAAERKVIEEEARRKARLALGTELESKSRELVEEQFAAVPEHERRAMLAGNAVKFFHLAAASD